MWKSCCCYGKSIIDVSVWNVEHWCEIMWYQLFGFVMWRLWLALKMWLKNPSFAWWAKNAQLLVSAKLPGSSCEINVEVYFSLWQMTGSSCEINNGCQMCSNLCFFFFLLVCTTVRKSISWGVRVRAFESSSTMQFIFKEFYFNVRWKEIIFNGSYMKTIS